MSLPQGCTSGAQFTQRRRSGVLRSSPSRSSEQFVPEDGWPGYEKNSRMAHTYFPVRLFALADGSLDFGPPATRKGFYAMRKIGVVFGLGGLGRGDASLRLPHRHHRRERGASPGNQYEFRAAQHSVHPRRRHAQGRSRVHAQDQDSVAEDGYDLRERLRLQPDMLSLSGHHHARPVRPQHPGLVQRRQLDRGLKSVP